ncbi:MauE/DoxX family redox-associated membrane protein [Nitrosomonas aestuarii]|uniref:MauE/DoxX family redox-associated membrane protein n=1 Tax=Nitrosomonas aestuarii TaxID=52441 RepID=UPI000D2F6993|nr:glutaredoxin [Nitrosomonas aestuarii]PTN11984.1 glutaredoxin [Nitrosomonas aestuarii]
MNEQISNEVFRKETCPYGKKAVKLLDQQGVDYQDHIFQSEKDEEDFKARWRVDTTPQIFLNGARIGGYTELADHYDVETDKDEAEETSYIPVIAVFGIALLMAILTQNIMYSFMGYALCLLACLKLMDLNGFVEGFKKYDLITKVWPFYGKIYPFAELIAGLGFLAPQYLHLTGWLALFVGIAGGISIFKAVYIDKTDLNCACIGGGSNVPLGAVSFSENAMMALMGAWVLFI